MEAVNLETLMPVEGLTEAETGFIGILIIVEM